MRNFREILRKRRSLMKMYENKDGRLYILKVLSLKASKCVCKFSSKIENFAFFLHFFSICEQFFFQIVNFKEILRKGRSLIMKM